MNHACSKDKTRYMYRMKETQVQYPRTDTALPLCNATEFISNRYALEFGSLDTSLIQQAKSNSITEASGLKTPDLSVAMGQNRCIHAIVSYFVNSTCTLVLQT